MKAIVIKEFCEHLDQPFNFFDTLYARGKHQNNRHLVRPPFTLGLEFSGIVISAPSHCQFKPGDAVFGGHQGSYAEVLTLAADSSSIQKILPEWTFTDAAGLSATLPVSYGALVLAGRLAPGETVLVHAATGGLGIMPVQIAVALGCRVLGTAGSDEKCAYARSYGASVCVNYSKAGWWERILQETDGKGVDVVYDPVGQVDLSLKCIAHRGRSLVVGFAAREGNMEKISMNRLLLKQVTLIGYRYGESVRRYRQEGGQIWSQLRPLIESGKIKPTVSTRYPGLESVPQALADISDRRILGKAVIKISADERQEQQSRL